MRRRALEVGASEGDLLLPPAYLARALAGRYKSVRCVACHALAKAPVVGFQITLLANGWRMIAGGHHCKDCAFAVLIPESEP